MKSQGFSYTTKYPRIPDKGKLDVCIFYDEIDNGMRAKEIAEYTLHRFNLECELELRIWNFAVLSIENVAESARQGCESADLIIFSLRDPAWLTTETVDQVAGWISQNQSHDCLVLCSVDPKIENRMHMASIHEAMDRLSRLSGMRCQIVYPVDLQKRLQPENPMISHPRVDPSLIGRLRRQVNPHQCWGINE